MSKLTNDLYKLSRKAGKLASTLNNIENISEGRLDKVVKKEVNKRIHKGINKTLK